MNAKKFFTHRRSQSVDVIFRSLVLFVMIVTMFAGVAPARAAEGDVEWVRTIATGEVEPGLFNSVKTALAPDGSIYLMGITTGDLSGQDMAGISDTFVRKYSNMGAELWTRMLGTNEQDIGWAVAADSTGVFFAGYTEGSFAGQANTSGHNAMVGKYDPDGNLAWLKQFGDADMIEAQALAVAGDRLYVAGWRYTPPFGGTYRDVFVQAYNTLDGAEVWAQSYVTEGDDIVGGIAVDNNAVYVTGHSHQPYGTRKLYLKTYSLSGVEGWSAEFQAANSISDEATSVGVFGSLVYVAGYTAGTLPGGTKVSGQDGFIKAFNLDGTEAWVLQFGNSTTTTVVEVRSLAVDASGIYLGGVTNGALAGSTNLGTWDAFIRRYSLAGEEGWTIQFGTADQDMQEGLGVDASGIYVSGRTQGALDGQAFSGVQDAFLKKVALDGSSLWTQQFSSDNFVPNYEIAHAVDAAGNAYIAGRIMHYISFYPIRYETTLFIAKYSPAGTQEWYNELQIERASETNPISMVKGLAVGPDGSVYLVGTVYANLFGETPLGGTDAFIRKYDPSGNEVWTRQFGTAENDYAIAVAADATGIYVGGETNGTMGAATYGYYDAFVRKFSPDGEVLWTDQFGSELRNVVNGIASDGTDLYVAGYTQSAMEGHDAYGSGDGFIRKYTQDGTVLWTELFGSEAYDEFNSVAADETGAYVAGYSFGTLPGQTKSAYAEPFAIKFAPTGGDPLWVRQVGTDYNDYAQSIAVNASGVYMGGYSITNMNHYPDRALLQKFSLDGELLWQNFFTDNSIHNIYGVAVDDTGIYLSGFRIGLDHTYGPDAALVKLSLASTNTAPTANPGGPYLGAINTSIAFDGSFSSDPENDPLTYSWSFGDGGTAAEATPAHVYTAAGVYQVCLTVSDGEFDSASACTLAVVYDPSAGFVTGGGWINSPAGAFLADDNLAGKATFGFVSRYQKGASLPSGNTAFAFDLAGLSFASSSYEWLVVNQSGANAQFKGSGLINGAADPNGSAYKFMLWASDGASTSSADTFRIKIWWEDAAGMHDVYDNGVAQPIGAGNIVVHKSK